MNAVDQCEELARELRETRNELEGAMEQLKTLNHMYQETRALLAASWADLKYRDERPALWKRVASYVGEECSK